MGFKLCLVALLAWASVAVSAAVHRQSQQQLGLLIEMNDERPYADDKIVRIRLPETRQFRDWMMAFMIETLGFDLISVNDNHAHVHLVPGQMDLLNIVMANYSLGNPEVVVSNLQDVVDREMARLNSSPLRQMSQREKFEAKNWFADYHPYDDILAWYKDLASKHSNLVTFIPSIGKTHQGNDIFALRITSPKDRYTKGQIWLHTGDHAREWIGPATMQYIVYTLLTGWGTDPVATSTLDRAELIIVPLMNIDGHKHTWNGARLWRKNRKPNKDIFGSIGVDLNRNWPSHWGEGGSSSSPFSDVYMGPSPGSELEVQALMKFFKNPNNTRLVGALDFHSFSQLILRPYGHSYEDSPDEALQKKAGDGMRDAIKAVHGKKYNSQKTIDLYKATGGCTDWFYDKEIYDWLPDRRLYSIAMELRPAEGFGGEGFILPPEEIIPTGEEIYAATTFFIDFALTHPIKV